MNITYSNFDNPELSSEDVAELLSLPWHITSTGCSNGREFVDPKTGWSYHVTIEWNNGIELQFGITCEHYEEIERRFEEAADDEWFDSPLPDWILAMMSPPSGSEGSN